MEEWRTRRAAEVLRRFAVPAGAAAHVFSGSRLLLPAAAFVRRCAASRIHKNLEAHPPPDVAHTLYVPSS
jgi:hypothetical protein